MKKSVLTEIHKVLKDSGHVDLASVVAKITEQKLSPDKIRKTLFAIAINGNYVVVILKTKEVLKGRLHQIGPSGASIKNKHFSFDQVSKIEERLIKNDKIVNIYSV